MSLKEALGLAKEREVDLVLITQEANPPVCKLIPWSKFKYEYSKKEKGTKHSVHMREMWFKPLIGTGDMEHKVNKIRGFLEDNQKVKLTVKPSRSTYRLDKSNYFNTLKKVLEKLEDIAAIEVEPKLEGKNVYAIIRSKK